MIKDENSLFFHLWKIFSEYSIPKERRETIQRNDKCIKIRLPYGRLANIDFAGEVYYIV